MAIFASKSVYTNRLNICKSCPEFRQKLYTCKECGCFMPAKAKIADIRCPLDKWKEVYGTEDSAPDTISFDRPKSEEDKKMSLIKTAESLRLEADKLEKEARSL